ncbi:DamX protein [Colwellia chukchiensis]|uniref:DamX protein n=1 Tax=Colwellia chukchiensis TaxID=641665 RepID=A0A1H7PS27_9GAMM|nr:hypothetical protein [Colwellia chukchiensis]SEL38572.1 DamX protein [Colwellia chukchiensis]
MSTSVKNIDLSKNKPSVTRISALARIDYILRFSKQAILVIDESAEQNAAISGQFLASLPEQHNAAYISLSNQFNDIQIRCRVIEQLASGELFDPEISLAVSVINFARKSEQTISIVLDKAQYLPLQILHELTQLTHIAKKAKLSINVVMFASAAAGKQVADNKALFSNKLALLSAQSGQLLAMSSALFTDSGNHRGFLQENKALMLLLMLLFVATLITIIWLQQVTQQDTSPILVDEPDSPVTHSQVEPALVEKNIGLEHAASKDTAVVNQAQIPQAQVAHVNDIYHALVMPSSFPNAALPVEAASAQEMFLALSTSKAANEQLADTGVTQSQAPTAIKTSHTNQLSQVRIDNEYFLKRSGYAIQIALLSDLTLPPDFLAELTAIKYYGYQRLLNGKPVLVITSQIYDDKASAQSALAALPQALLTRQPWIKPVAVIHKEIQALLSRQ